MGSAANELSCMQDSMMTKYLTKAYTDNYQWRIDRMKNETAEQKSDRKTRYKLNTSQLTHIQKAGITILAGSDEAALNTFVYPGESLIDELHIFQEAGMKPVEILRSATINGAAPQNLATHRRRRTRAYPAGHRARVDDILDLRSNALLVRWVNFGTARTGGGALCFTISFTFTGISLTQPFGEPSRAPRKSTRRDT
jgi:hypothetical protein